VREEAKVKKGRASSTQHQSIKWWEVGDNMLDGAAMMSQGPISHEEIGESQESTEEVKFST